MYRKSIRFDSIELCKIDSELSELTNTRELVNIAEVFIDEKVEDSNKYHLKNTCFEDLGDSLPNLIRLFYDTEEKKPSYSLGFIPDNDNERNHITNMKIKEICTALECEFSFQKQLKNIVRIIPE